MAAEELEPMTSGRCSIEENFALKSCRADKRRVLVKATEVR